jgi:DNA-directed RNA polymerase subunit RPC12/RpoP
MGALAPPTGALFVGAEGDLFEQRFRVLGRVRYGYTEGVWNEWYLGFEDGQIGWLSEDEGDLEFEVHKELDSLPFGPGDVSPGDRLEVDGTTFRVGEKDVAVCEGGEGQLPFPVYLGDRFPYLELFAGETFATVEYNPRGGVRFFQGRRLLAGELRLDQTREEAGIGPEVLSLGLPGTGPAGSSPRERVVLGAGGSLEIDCEKCGAPLGVPPPGGNSLECPYCEFTLDLSLTRCRCPQCSKMVVLHQEGTRAATCPHCHSLLEVDSETVSLLKNLQGRKAPSLELKPGMKGRLDGDEVEVIGHMRFVEHGPYKTYHSNEFYLHKNLKVRSEFFWLVKDNDGNWWKKYELPDPPDFDPRTAQEGQMVRYRETNFRVEEVQLDGKEVLDWVEGEFSWVPKVNDSSAYMDAFGAGGSQLLGAEWTAKEMEWTWSNRLPLPLLQKAFGLSSSASSSAPLAASGAAWMKDDDDDDGFELGGCFEIAKILFFILAFLLMSIDDCDGGGGGYSSGFSGGSYSFGK